MNSSFVEFLTGVIEISQLVSGETRVIANQLGRIVILHLRTKFG